MSYLPSSIIVSHVACPLLGENTASFITQEGACRVLAMFCGREGWDRANARGGRTWDGGANSRGTCGPGDKYDFYLRLAVALARHS